MLLAVKILQIHNRYRQAGGEDVLVDSEAELLRSGGHDVTQFTSENPVDAVATATAMALSPWNPWSARQVGAVVDEYRPEIAHVHNTWFSLSPSVLRAVKRRDVPVVMTLHNFRLLCTNALLFRDQRPCEDCVGTHPWHGVRHRCYRDSLAASAVAATAIAVNRAAGTWVRQIDAFLALSDFAKGLFVEGGIPEYKILVRSNFVADPGPRTGSPSSSSRLIYLGRLVPEKGIDKLVDAWESVDTEGLELVVIGDGPLRPVLQRRDVDGVHLLGQLTRAQVSRELKQARALIFPSIWYEGQPMAILEALAAGLPVLGSDLGGIAELLAPLGREWLAAPGDPEVWASAILSIRDDAAVDEAGRRARDLYERCFTPELALTQLENAYGSLTEI